MDRQKYLDQREVKLLRAVTENQSIEDMKVGLIGGVLRWMVVDTAMSTGLRVAELAALRCGDVNLSRSCLTITRGKRKIRKPETLAIGKDFAEHLREFMEWKSRVGQPIGKTDVLFMGKRGPLTRQGLQWIWGRAICLAALPPELSIHSARHTVAVHLLRKTRNLRHVQKQLGHASPTTTANMYADIPFEEMQAGVQGLYDDTG
jgi:integrase/recombinase XerD